MDNQIPFYVAFSKTMFGLNWHQVGNFLLPDFLSRLIKFS
jgi:hypothetical protein